MTFTKSLVLNEKDLDSLVLDLLEIIKKEKTKFNSWEELENRIEKELALILDKQQVDDFLIILDKQLEFMLEDYLAETIVNWYEESFKEFVEEVIK
ncbi:MAG TPA: hypothetical protein ENO30_04915 [Thermodesulfobium narugense]|nr:hypothetical protein [Thermodesulfobium narugense]